MLRKNKQVSGISNITRRKIKSLINRRRSQDFKLRRALYGEQNGACDGVVSEERDVEQIEPKRASSIWDKMTGIKATEMALSV